MAFRRSFLPLPLEWLVSVASRLFYRVRAIDREKVPAEGGLVLVANHLSLIDPLVLQRACPRRLRFIIRERQMESLRLRLAAQLNHAIVLADEQPLETSLPLREALRRGEAVCIFPEGSISRTGQLLALQPGFSRLAQAAGVPVVPVAHDGLWGSIFSFSENKYLFKSPRLLPTPVCVCFGAPLPAAEAGVTAVRAALLDLASRAFSQRPQLQRHLGREAVRSLAKRPRRLALVDRTAARREVSAGKLLAAAAALSRRLREQVPERRVGIVLPPGAGAMIANLAVVCAGKVPVNLNFTAGVAAIGSSLRVGEISTVLSAEAMRAKLPEFPWPARTLDLKAELEAVGKRRILFWLLGVFLTPNQVFADLLGLPRRGGDEEAALLFTSGSSGEPKGVVYTHRNILANCWQISSTTVLPEAGCMLACLPLFHSFGFTITIWYGLIRRIRLVTVPSPLDTKKIAEAIREEAATVVIGAPTFLRPLLKRAESRDLRSLELVVSGAEKMPADLHESFRLRYHIPVMQGYGLTETAPVISVNQHHAPGHWSWNDPQEGNRLGSVGRMLPGLTARIADPDTMELLPLTETGLLLVRGPNVFPGYLGDAAKTEAAFHQGWFVTGDLARFDEAGFLYIEGRLSRFSKIGGEMVPHGTVEQLVNDGLGWEQLEGPSLVVVGVSDRTKGEALVLLTTREVTFEAVRDALGSAGVPNLWIPRIIQRVDAIPLLGTGKLDLATCRQIAREAVDKPKPS